MRARLIERANSQVGPLSEADRWRNSKLATLPR